MPSGIYTGSPDIDNALVDSANWADMDWVHAQFAWLRKNDPLRRMHPKGYDPFWSVTKFDQIKEVELAKDVFLSAPVTSLEPAMLRETLQSISGRENLIRSLVQMDAPDHMKYRVLTQSWFARSNLSKIEARISLLAAQYVDQMVSGAGHCDFVKDLAVPFPLHVIMSILGIPEKDEPFMLKLTQELLGPDDPDNHRSFDSMDLMEVVTDFERYFDELAKDRRLNPTDDLATAIANGQIDGQSMPDLETYGYYIIVATAGHETTSAAISGALLALLQNPDQMNLLRSNVDEYLDDFIEESLRWVSPVRHFVRTPTQDYWLGEQLIPKGESVALWYPSGNRDELVFERSDRFDIERANKRHIAFGHGSHLCLGQHLARMEMRALFRELLSRVNDIELNGEFHFTHTAFVGGLKALPLSYSFV